MLKKPKPKRKPRPADTLLRTSKKGKVELTEKELGKVTGGVGKFAEFKYIKGESLD
jgi:hypothetical protein